MDKIKEKGSLAMKNKYFDLPSRLEENFAEIDSDIVMDLQNCDEKYADVLRQITELKACHPFIDKMVEDNSEIHLTVEEHKVFVEYVRLCQQKENMERLQIYFRGHTDAVAYLKKIGVL